jgi:hypothetical protein
MNHTASHPEHALVRAAGTPPNRALRSRAHGAAQAQEGGRRGRSHVRAMRSHDARCDEADLEIRELMLRYG